MRFYALLFAVCALAQAAAPVYGYKVVKTYPHDRAAFTQGLQYTDGIFYEGTGLNGRSSIRKVELATGKVLQLRNVDRQYFGEGIVTVEIGRAHV